jgi:hypothetical protein
LNSPAFSAENKEISMTRVTILLAAGAATLAVAVPAAAQTPYPYYPQQTYPQGQYAYPQQGQGVIGQMIGQLLGNRYQANDRYAVERCATAAIAQANAQYRRSPYAQGYGDPNQGYGYGNQGYNPAASMRVTAITQVERRQGGLRVSGMLDSRGGYQAPYGQPPYGNAYGYQGQGYQGQGYQGQAYAAQGDLTFRCNVDYRGAVTNVRIRRNQTAYNRGY